MLRSLKIENFRCFSRFEIEQLGRLNLLVGTNNSGKTSILEAVRLLASPSNLEPLRELMIQRGEYLISEEQAGQPELDIRHLFYGHRFEVGSRFSILGNNRSESCGCIVSVRESKRQSLFENDANIVVKVDWLKTVPEDYEFPLSDAGGLPLAFLKQARQDFRKIKAKTQFVRAASLDRGEILELFDRIVLTPEESLLIEALQTIAPEIERIAAVGYDRRKYTSSRSGFVIKIFEENQPIPIGSMGDGLWRMLGLTLALVNAKDGVLLVDEIDTGFHFSVMAKMWKLVWETAKRLNVQVFATTHNSDCWTSLAGIASAESPSEDGITIQRIERGKPHGVVFTERQIAIAAERGIEVR